MPKFSIILPVKNGGHYVKECVGSILAQTFTDFDLLVLDNQSTDGTREWIQSVGDPRIRLFPAEKPLTIEENWGRIVSIPKNDFITMIGHDDVLEPGYLETMYELIQKYPGASLFQSHFKYIDAEGKFIRDCKPMKETESAWNLLDQVLTNNMDIMGTGFLMRAKDYDALGGIPPYPNLLFADLEMWISLTALSFKITSMKSCFSYRIHRGTTTLSPDRKFQDAFERFIYFLAKLKNSREEYARSVSQYGATYLLGYCKSLSHRLLRTAYGKRDGLTVRKYINKYRTYAELLGVGETFRPYRVFSIRVAAIIDSNSLLRALFLGFKRIFPKPVMK